MDKQKIRIIEKNDERSMEYQPGDILAVDSTWHGGVDMASVSGVPLSLGRDEYEVLKNEGQPPHSIGAYSYEVGVMDCFYEMVSNGLKKLVMGHPCDARAERDPHLGQVQRLYTEYEIRYYPRDQTLIVDLFSERANKDKLNYLLFRTEDVLEQYTVLEERQRYLIGDNGYTAQARCELTVGFGLFLSYPESGIARLVQKTTRKQQTENHNGVFSESESI